jgi:tRNA nucleotidyltransferase/poly(A) polymerase
LRNAGFEAFIVGGCVRDLLRRAKPKDWDITTSAKPEEIQKIFPESFYENKFLTVTAKTESEDPALKEIEITTFRAEGKYTDKRHPDEVRFAKTLEEDLGRRDFTANAIAMKIQNSESGIQNYELIDPFGGKEDIENKIIRAVGKPKDRFNEDALRMMRAVRLAIQLDFEIEPETLCAIKDEAASLKFIAKERIRDELEKIFDTPRAKEGIELLHDAGLLKFIIPELEEGIGVTQNKAHAYKVWEHNLE